MNLTFEKLISVATKQTTIIATAAVKIKGTSHCHIPFWKAVNNLNVSIFIHIRHGKRPITAATIIVSMLFLKSCDSIIPHIASARAAI